MLSVPGPTRRGKYAERPAPCWSCGAPTWWNGHRVVASVQKAPGAAPVTRETGIVRRRVRCSTCDVPDCVVYEDGAYPHRTFQPEVAASATAQVTGAHATLTAAAAKHQCSRDTVRRWLRWIETLAEPCVLERLCARIDPRGVPAAAKQPMNPAGRALQLFEHLADLLFVRGVALPRHGAGLARILIDRWQRFREVFYLTKSSPPLRADLLTLGV